MAISIVYYSGISNPCLKLAGVWSPTASSNILVVYPLVISQCKMDSVVGGGAWTSEKQTLLMGFSNNKTKQNLIPRLKLQNSQDSSYLNIWKRPAKPNYLHC